MTTVLLVRHAHSTGNRDHRLVGRTPGVGLDDLGQQQAQALAAALNGSTLTHLVSSPLQRCHETLAPLAENSGLAPITEERFAEVEYGEWTGGKLEVLAQDPLWPQIQAVPSRVRFPGGESMIEAQARAVSALYDWDMRVKRESGEEAVWLVCTHEDIVKSLLASISGAPFDMFQRFTARNAAVTRVSLEGQRPQILSINES